MSKLSETQARQIALYACKIIESYLVELQNASYPQPVESHPSYVYFDAHMDNIKRMINGEDIKDIVASMKKENEDGQ